MNPQNKTGREAFVAIGQKILKADTAEDIICLFEVLKGDQPISDVKSFGSHSLANESNSGWSAATSWVEWWMRKTIYVSLIIAWELIIDVL